MTLHVNHLKAATTPALRAARALTSFILLLLGQVVLCLQNTVAAPVTLAVSGALDGGGSYSGTFSYDSLAADQNSSNSDYGQFYPSAFDIYVNTGDSSSSHHITSSGQNVFNSYMYRYAGSLASATVLYFTNFDNPPSFYKSVSLRLVFIQTPGNFNPNLAPSPTDFGAFAENVSFGGGGWDNSFYEFHYEDYINPSQSVYNYLTVESGLVSTVPDGFATVALLGIGVAMLRPILGRSRTPVVSRSEWGG